jgi:asparagine synthase (glutamine-hydrolysing)
VVAGDARAVHGHRRRQLRLLAAGPAQGARPLEEATASAAAWLRGELEPFARETLSTETLRRQGYLRPEAVARVLDDHIAGREDLSRQLWGLLSFTLWHERHVEGIRRDATVTRAVAGSA